MNVRSLGCSAVIMYPIMGSAYALSIEACTSNYSDDLDVEGRKDRDVHNKVKDGDELLNVSIRHDNKTRKL